MRINTPAEPPKPAWKQGHIYQMRTTIKTIFLCSVVDSKKVLVGLETGLVWTAPERENFDDVTDQFEVRRIEK